MLDYEKCQLKSVKVCLAKKYGERRKKRVSHANKLLSQLCLDLKCSKSGSSKQISVFRSTYPMPSLVRGKVKWKRESCPYFQKKRGEIS